MDKFDVKSFHFKQYFSPSTEPIVAVTIQFNSMHITFYCQSFYLEEIEKFFFSQQDLLLALSESDDPVSVVSSSYAELPIGTLCIS